MAKPTALRTSLIWHDEVMGDVVSKRPQPITIGPFDGATFITPNIGLPIGFAIVRPGSRGNLLALGEQMRGTVCIGGVEHDVAELVQTSDTPGFYATAISGLDWGVIELDATGMYKLFFQFVPLDDDAAPPLPRQVLLAGLAGYVTSIVALSIMWSTKGFGVGEAVFRGGALATLALAAAALLRWVLEQDNESRASLAFSTLLHAALLFATFQLYEHGDPFVWPGPRELTASYIVSRIETTPTIAKPAIAMPAPTTIATTTPISKTLPVPRPWHEPTVRKPTPTPTAQPKGLPGLDPGATNAIASLIAGNRHGGVDGLVGGIGGETGHSGLQGTQIGGPTTRGNPGTGPAGRFHVGVPGALDVGPLRDGTICVGGGCAGAPPVGITPIGPPTDDDGPTLTSTDIDKVIHAASHRLASCYERELNHTPTLAGTVSIRFEIGPDGRVKTARVTRSTVASENVGDCVSRAITLLRFPPRGGGAVVNYPFVFAPKG